MLAALALNPFCQLLPVRYCRFYFAVGCRCSVIIPRNQIKAGVNVCGQPLKIGLFSGLFCFGRIIYRFCLKVRSMAFYRCFRGVFPCCGYTHKCYSVGFGNAAAAVHELPGFLTERRQFVSRQRVYWLRALHCFRLYCRSTIPAGLSVISFDSVSALTYSADIKSPCVKFMPYFAKKEVSSRF